jgi:hypothetical protein
MTATLHGNRCNRGLQAPASKQEINRVTGRLVGFNFFQAFQSVDI